MKRKDIYTEAWNITWKYRFLWIFGFVAGITFNTKSSTTDYLSSGAWLFQDLGSIISSNMGSTTVLIMGVGILLWLVGLVARADLIYGVASIANIAKVKADQVSFTTMLPLGFNSLPKLAGMQIIVWLPFTVFALIPASQTPQMLGGESSSFFLDFTSTSVGVTIGLVLFLGLSSVDAFAFRLIVLGNQSIISSIQQAGQIIRHNWGKILQTTILCGIFGLIFSAIIGIPLAPLITFLLAPLMEPVQEAMRECTANNVEFEAITKCVQGIRTSPTTYAVLLPTSVIIAGFYSVWTTFLSTVFTLLYGDIINLSATTGRRKRNAVRTV